MQQQNNNVSNYLTLFIISFIFVITMITLIKLYIRFYKIFTDYKNQRKQQEYAAILQNATRRKLSVRKY